MHKPHDSHELCLETRASDRYRCARMQGFPKWAMLGLNQRYLRFDMLNDRDGVRAAGVAGHAVDEIGRLGERRHSEDARVGRWTRASADATIRLGSGANLLPKPGQIPLNPTEQARRIACKRARD